MENSEKNLRTVSISNCRVGKISSSRPIEEDQLIPEIDFEKEDSEASSETADPEIF